MWLIDYKHLSNAYDVGEENVSLALGHMVIARPWKHRAVAKGSVSTGDCPDLWTRPSRCQQITNLTYNFLLPRLPGNIQPPSLYTDNSPSLQTEKYLQAQSFHCNLTRKYLSTINCKLINRPLSIQHNLCFTEHKPPMNWDRSISWSSKQTATFFQHQFILG